MKLCEVKTMKWLKEIFCPKKDKIQTNTITENDYDTSILRRRTANKEAIDFWLDDIQKPHIICNGKKYSINWNKVITYKSQNGLTLPETHYRKYSSKRKVNMFVTHWDVCLSSKSFKSCRISVPDILLIISNMKARTSFMSSPISFLFNLETSSSMV